MTWTGRYVSILLLTTLSDAEFNAESNETGLESIGVREVGENTKRVVFEKGRKNFEFRRRPRSSILTSDLDSA